MKRDLSRRSADFLKGANVDSDTIWLKSARGTIRRKVTVRPLHVTAFSKPVFPSPEYGPAYEEVPSALRGTSSTASG